MRRVLSEIYFGLCLARPGLAGLLLLALAAGAGYFAQDFRLDASADSLILENDDDLRYYRRVSERYGSDESLVVTYTPQGDLFSDAVLHRIKALRDELAALPAVSGVTSLLDVPLIQSPPVSLSEIQDGVRTLLDPATDRELARQEFAQSPLYNRLLTDPAGQTTAMLVSLRTDPQASELLQRREALRAEARERELSTEEAAELDAVSAQFRQLSGQRQAAQQDTVAAVRAVMARHQESAQLHLGGLPMIASDMIDFVRADIRLFSVLVGLFLLVLLAFAFRQLRWVVVPLAICGAVSLAMVGLLGLMHWPVTVVSSNFTSLTLIITLSLVVHLVVRYRELQAQDPQAEQSALLRETVRSKFAPSLYTALTTMVSFGSLVIADIRPVIDFGVMMVWAVVLAFVLSFWMFPSALARLAPRGAGASRVDITARITQGFASGVQSRGALLLAGYLLFATLAGIGISRLGVENRFIDYFQEDTEIYQGMVLIDKKLGGTTPLDVIIDAPASFFEEADDFADEFADEFSDDAGLSGSSYWFNVFALERVGAMHDYLDALPETGKVLSMASTMDFISILNGDEPLDNFTLAVMHGRLPDDIKQTLFDPYLAEDGNQIRFAIRVIDSDQNLNRNDLLKKVRREMLAKFDLQPEQLHLTGALVLYNNVLQSLFESQILTLSAVFAAILLMLWGLFGSLRVALIGITPTLFAAAFILGLMGWLNIPLDIMTITIAAIVIGIGVDNTIHYTHRFQEEIAQGTERWQAMRNTHGSVGRAIYLTSIIVTLGFSILGLSNFVPITYFGLFTGLAMLLALVANLTLLPLLLVKLGPKVA